MPVACLWGKAFNIPLSTLQSATSMLSSFGPHTTSLSYHQPGQAQLSVFNDLNSFQSDCDAPVESYTPRATIHHHHATVLIQEPDVVASRCYFSPPEVVPLLAVAFCSPLEERRRPPSNAPKYPPSSSPDSRPTQRPALRNGFGKAAGALLRARILPTAQLRRPPHSRH